VTNTDAAWIAGLIFAAALLDMIFNHGRASLFLVLKLMDLIQYMRFWDGIETFHS
jgi:uncharacterized membrane protein